MADLIGVGDPHMPAAALRILRAGGVLIMPCDTMYGIVGIAPDSEARLRAIKGREEGKPFIELIAEESWLEDLSEARLPRELLDVWPGPLTVVVPARGGGTLAVRLPDDELLRSLMRSLGRPLYSTSVNTAGAPPLSALEEILSGFGALVDLVVSSGDRPTGPASTIVDVCRKPYRLLRQGALRLPPDLFEP